MSNVWHLLTIFWAAPKGSSLALPSSAHSLSPWVLAGCTPLLLLGGPFMVLASPETGVFCCDWAPLSPGASPETS